MQPGVEAGAYGAAVGQANIDVVGVIESGIGISRQAALRPRSDRLDRRPVTVRQTEDAVAQARGVMTVDESLGDVAVEPEIPFGATFLARIRGVRRRGAAIYDLVLRAVDLNVAALSPVIGRQREPSADQRPLPAELPSSHHGIDKAVRFTQPAFAFAQRQLVLNVPTNAMLWNRGLAPVVEQPVEFVEVGGNCPRKKYLRTSHHAVAEAVARVPQRVGKSVERLESESVAEAALNLEVEFLRIRVARSAIKNDVGVRFFVVDATRHVCECSGRKRLSGCRKPDVVVRLRVDVGLLLEPVGMASLVVEPNYRASGKLFFESEVPLMNARVGLIVSQSRYKQSTPDGRWIVEVYHVRAVRSRDCRRNRAQEIVCNSIRTLRRRVQVEVKVRHEGWSAAKRLKDVSKRHWEDVVAIPAAHDHFLPSVGQSVCESQSRADVIIVRLEDLLPKPGFLRGFELHSDVLINRDYLLRSGARGDVTAERLRIHQRM